MHAKIFIDFIIIATALLAECQWLYTEDMQHGLKINGQLTLTNPFISQP